MSIYKYKLGNYHAIKEAEIEIDGITVLAGVNGSGKSTLSRWLYYLVNGAEMYDRLLFQDFKRRLSHSIQQKIMVYRDMRRTLGDNTLRAITNASVMSTSDIDKVDYDDDKSSILVLDAYIHQLNLFCDKLRQYLSDQSDLARRNRILNFLGIEERGIRENGQLVEDFYDLELQRANQLTEKMFQDKESRPIDKFFSLVARYYDETDTPPANLQLEEDGAGLFIGNTLGNLYNLQRAIYVDSPMALTVETANNHFWQELHNIVLQDNKELSLEEKKLVRRIQNLLDGNVEVKEAETPFDNKELRYVSSDNVVNIGIEKTATGFKTFTYLMRFLQSGILKENTLLLIDEPEAHLHPKWIFDYAQLLVLLNKHLDLKVMVASHNPDMVAALKAVAEKEGMLGKVHFYLSEQVTDSYHQFSYRDCGQEIAPIFESFNIALTRINAYGTGSL